MFDHDDLRGKLNIQRQFAFPLNIVDFTISHGLTKREFFAGMALAGAGKSVLLRAEGKAREAVEIADALIAELAKEKTD